MSGGVEVGIGVGHVLLAAQKVERLVDGNTVEPGGNLGIALEPVDVHPRLHQHILHHIVGVVVIEHKVSYLPIQHLAILADDEPECLALGLGRREHLQKCVVVDCHR